MTVLSTDPPYSQYTGTGERVFYEYGWDWTGEPVYVEVGGLPVTFTQQSTGVLLDTAPALGVSIVIYRETEITQERDFTAFDSFDAHWTEDALDKLILLKQEAGQYRAALNLDVNRNVERVRLLNDKGTDPDIFIWNTDMAGVFSGEVTDSPPLIGSFVDKPDDFVYLFYGNPFQVQEFTTTLYPVEATDAIAFDADLDVAYMVEYPEDNILQSGSLISGSIYPALISAPEQTDNILQSGSIISGSIYVGLITAPEQSGNVLQSGSLISASIQSLLVTAYDPDHGLIMSIDLDAANCSLDLI
jgi:hypothetical protein